MQFATAIDFTERETLFVEVVLPLSLLVLARSAADLDLFQLGEVSAHAAGLNGERLKSRVVLASSLGVGLCVALTGIIGFIGLLVPHCLRLYFGPGHRLLIPASMLCGAILLLLADTLARSLVSPAEIPVGLVTSVIGGPYFLPLDHAAKTEINQLVREHGPLDIKPKEQSCLKPK